MLLAATQEPGCGWDGTVEDDDGAEWAQNLSSFMTLAIAGGGANRIQLADICESSNNVANGLLHSAQLILPPLCGIEG